MPTPVIHPIALVYWRLHAYECKFPPPFSLSILSIRGVWLSLCGKDIGVESDGSCSVVMRLGRPEQVHNYNALNLANSAWGPYNTGTGMGTV